MGSKLNIAKVLAICLIVEQLLGVVMTLTPPTTKPTTKGIRQSWWDAVAFTVTSTQDFGSKNMRTPIPFPNTVTNIGGGWVLGQFIAPTDGLYAFYLRVHNKGYGNANNEISITRNNETQLSTYTKPDLSENSMSLVLSLMVGDVVEAQLGPYSELEGSRPGYTRQHHFTGFLFYSW